MADHAHARIAHGGDYAAGLRCAVELEVRVDRSQAEVERAAELGVIVELAGRADVEFDAVQQSNRIAELLLQRADAFALR